MTDEICIRRKYSKLTKVLIERGLTITTMESATAGQIASLLTDTEGASAIMKGAFITYSNEAKIMGGVPSEIIEKYSVYSKETAAAMASAAGKKMHADLAVGITGTFGNIDPENSGASVPGVIFFAIDYCGKTEVFERHLPFLESRLMYKLAAAEEVYDVLAEILNI